jgi:uncharacterized delta-60 repeat protein
VAVQPDGKIVVAGEAKGATDTDFVAVRYEADGTPDPTFGGGDGIELVPLTGTEDRAEAVAIGAGGRILLAGEARTPTKGTAAEVAVLRSDGKPDPSFDTDGVKTVQTTGGEEADRGEGIAEQADGKVVIADATGNGAGNGFTLVRLLPSGALDPEFGTLGVVSTPVPGAKNPGARGRSTDVLVQPDGRIVASGYGYDEGPKEEFDSKFAAARYLADGKLDPNFGGAGSGIFTHQVVPGSDDEARTAALAQGGRLVLAGNSSGPGPGDDSPAVVRLDANGVLDPSFGAGGVALRGPTAPFGNIFQDAAVDYRERVVVAGEDFIGNGNTEAEVSRFLGDLAPEASGSPESKPPPPLGAQPVPHARMKAIPRRLGASKLTGFSGSAGDPGGTLSKVQIAVVRLASGGAKASRASATCEVLKNAKARFRTVKTKNGVCPQRWLSAKGTAKWRFKLKRKLPPGRYVAFARAVDASGVAEATFSRAAGNRFAFHLLAK